LGKWDIHSCSVKTIKQYVGTFDYYCQFVWAANSRDIQPLTGNQIRVWNVGLKASILILTDAMSQIPNFLKQSEQAIKHIAFIKGVKGCLGRRIARARFTKST